MYNNRGMYECVCMHVCMAFLHIYTHILVESMSIRMNMYVRTQYICMYERRAYIDCIHVHLHEYVCKNAIHIHMYVRPPYIYICM